MSIYIKGMEMPNDGRPRKALFTLKDGVPVVIVEAAKSYDDKHINVHPLVPVPDHGRLGDLDALMLKIQEYIEEYADLDENGYHNLKWCAMKETEMALNDAQTIIPANRETDHE